MDKSSLWMDNVFDLHTGYCFELTFLSIRVTVQNEKDRFFVTSTADNLWSKPLDTYLQFTKKTVSVPLY